MRLSVASARPDGGTAIVPQLREFLTQVNLGAQSGFLNLDVLDLESVTLAPLDALCKPAANQAPLYTLREGWFSGSARCLRTDTPDFSVIG